MKLLVAVTLIAFGSAAAFAQSDACNCLRLELSDNANTHQSKASVVDQYYEPVHTTRVQWKLNNAIVISGLNSSVMTFEPTGMGVTVDITAEVTGQGGCTVLLKRSFDNNPSISLDCYFGENTDLAKSTADWLINSLASADNPGIPVVLEITFPSSTKKKDRVATLKRLLEFCRIRGMSAKNMSRVLFYFHPDGNQSIRVWRVQPGDRPDCRNVEMSKTIPADELQKRLSHLFN